MGISGPQFKSNNNKKEQMSCPHNDLCFTNRFNSDLKQQGTLWPVIRGFYVLGS